MKRASIVVLALLAARCSFFSKSQSRIYSIDRIDAGTPVVASGAPVAIDGIELPPGFDRREIVVRAAGSQLQVRSNDLWPATLQDVALHTLAADLATRLPTGMIVLPGQVRPMGNVRAIDVVIIDLAPGPDARITLTAQWTLVTPGAASTTHREQLAIDVPSLDSANVAAGMSRVLAALADRIAAGLTAR